MPDHTDPYSNIHVVWLALTRLYVLYPYRPPPSVYSQRPGKLETMQNDANGWILISNLSRAQNGVNGANGHVLRGLAHAASGADLSALGPSHRSELGLNWGNPGKDT